MTRVTLARMLHWRARTAAVPAVTPAPGPGPRTRVFRVPWDPFEWIGYCQTCDMFMVTPSSCRVATWESAFWWADQHVRWHRGLLPGPYEK